MYRSTCNTIKVTIVDIWAWMTDLVANYGYTGAFFISIFGNFTVFFPVPYVITIYAFGASLNPLLLGISCGLGATIGEFSAYLIGRGGRSSQHRSSIITNKRGAGFRSIIGI